MQGHRITRAIQLIRLTVSIFSTFTIWSLYASSIRTIDTTVRSIRKLSDLPTQHSHWCIVLLTWINLYRYSMLQDMNRLKLGIARTSNDGHKDAQNDLMTNKYKRNLRESSKSSESSVLLRRMVISSVPTIYGYWNKCWINERNKTGLKEKEKKEKRRKEKRRKGKE